MSADYVPSTVNTSVLTEPKTISSALDTLDSEAFLNLFVAQLRFQNPMEPSGGTEMMLQTAQFTQVETLTKILEAQQDLMGMTQMNTATALVGQQVTATLPGVGQVTGAVDGFHVGEDGPVLHVAGHDVPLSAAASIGSASTAGLASAPASAQADAATAAAAAAAGSEEPTA